DGLSILCYASSHAHYAYLIPIRGLEVRALQTLVIIVAYLSLAWSAVVQAQLGTAWRIGIDPEDKSELVTNGLYSLSRHPTYLGFMVMAVALCLAMPNAVSLVAASLAVAVLPIEARLEEDFLITRHGDHHSAYRQRTRRWL